MKWEVFSMSTSYVPVWYEPKPHSEIRHCTLCRKPFEYRAEREDVAGNLPVDWVCRDCFPDWVLSSYARHWDERGTRTRKRA